MKTSLLTLRFDFLKAFLCLSLFFVFVAAAYSDDVIWQGTQQNGLWDDDTANWLKGSVTIPYKDFNPVDTLVFNDSGVKVVNVTPGDITLSKSFVVDNSAGQNYTIKGGALKGSGGIEKRGGGSLFLASANTYSGATNVSGGGSLILADPYAAQNSAISVTGSILRAERPGTVVKSLSLNNSLFQVNVDSSNIGSPAFTATSGFNFVGTDSQLDISISGFTGTPVTYWVLSGNNAGGFNPDNIYVNVPGAGARVRREVIRESDSLYVSLTMSSFGALYGSLLTENGWWVTQVVDHAMDMGIHTPLFSALEALPASAEFVSFALNQLHAEAYVAGMSYAVQLQRSFNARLMNWRNMVANNGYYGYTDCYGCTDCGDACGYHGRKPRRYDLWATVSAETISRGRIKDYAGYNGDSCGLAVGAEWKFSPCTYGGIAFGYDDASMYYKNLNVDNSLRAARISLYGGYVNSCWYSSGYLGYSKDWQDVTRRIRIPAYQSTTPPINAPGFSANARGRYNDDVFSTGFELGKFYSCYDLNIIPTIGLDYIYIHSPRIRETQAGSASLVVNSMAYNSLRSPVGIRTNMDICVFSGLVLTPELRLFGVTEWIDRSVRRSAYFADAQRAGNFYSNGGGWGRNGFLFGLGLTAQCGCRVTVGLNYDCESWKDYNTHIGSAFINYRW